MRRLNLVVLCLVGFFVFVGLVFANEKTSDVEPVVEYELTVGDFSSERSLMALDYVDLVEEQEFFVVWKDEGFTVVNKTYETSFFEGLKLVAFESVSLEMFSCFDSVDAIQFALDQSGDVRFMEDVYFVDVEFVLSRNSVLWGNNCTFVLVGEYRAFRINTMGFELTVCDVGMVQEEFYVSESFG